MSGAINLGPRLRLVASFVPKGAKLGDIGTDHAYLPIFLWEQGMIQRAVAVDIHEGPYKSARSAIQSRQLESIIDVRFGDGLKPIEPGEVNTLTLAGMGGNTMLEIFNAKPAVLNQVNTLVLQPQGAEGKVRLTLLQSGWKLVNEQLVEEDRIYVVMRFSRNEGFSFEEIKNKVHQWFGQVSIEQGASDETRKMEDGQSQQGILSARDVLAKLVWDLGPLVLEHPVPQVKVLIEDQVRMIEHAIREMQKSTKPEVQERIQQQSLTRSLLEGMKKCLFPLA